MLNLFLLTDVMHFCICCIYIGNENRVSLADNQSASTVAEMATAMPSNDSSHLDFKHSRHISSASLVNLDQVNINIKIENHLADETYL